MSEMDGSPHCWGAVLFREGRNQRGGEFHHTSNPRAVAIGVHATIVSFQGSVMFMIRFTKMQALGNDYVYLDAITEPSLAERADLADLARRMSDRRFGIGSDGLIIIQRPDDDSGIETGRGVRMRIFNADGSEAEMCGNGIRCVAKFVIERGLVSVGSDEALLVQTGAGVLSLRSLVRDGRVESVTVDMGKPVVDPEAIGVDVGALGDQSGPAFRLLLPDDAFSDLDVVFVGMGNPHAVVFCDDVGSIPLERIGPLIESHRAFPNRINVHFAQVVSDGEVIIRTWERGSGITMACGTGASAVCVAGVLEQRTGRQLLIHLPGGNLDIEWREDDGHVLMTGPAVEVFRGEWLGSC